MTTHDQAAQRCIDFIKRQLNVNNYTLFPKWSQAYSESYTDYVTGTVDMPVDATIIWPKYIYCDQFYTPEFSGICTGKHQNTGTARRNLGVEIATISDGRYVSAVCALKQDGTWRSEKYVRVTEIYGKDGRETRRVTYWYAEDDEVNSSGSNNLKDFKLKYYDWVDDQGNEIDPDNLPPTEKSGTSEEGQTLMDTEVYVLDPVLLDDNSVDDAVPFYLDYQAEFYVFADVEYLVDTGNILYDQVVTSTDLQANPPVLSDLPQPWIKDVIFTPSTDKDTLSVSWISNFSDDCTVTVGGNSKVVTAQQIEDGMRTYKATISAPRGSQYNYDVTGKGVTVSGVINTPSNNHYRIAGDPQLTNQTSADNWYKAQDENGLLLTQATLILSMGDQVDSIADPELRDEQYTMFTKDQKSPIMVTRGNHDDNDAFFAHFNLPNSNGADYHFIHNDMLFVVLDTNHTDYQKHKDTIDAGLASGTYTWAVLIMHHGIYTSGSNAKDTNVVNLRDALSDFIMSKPFDFILSGHDHIYSRTSQPGKPFITAPSSSGSKYYKVDPSLPWTETYKELNVPAFIDMDVSPTQIDFSVVDITRTVHDQFTITK